MPYMRENGLAVAKEVFCGPKHMKKKSKPGNIVDHDGRLCEILVCPDRGKWIYQSLDSLNYGKSKRKMTIWCSKCNAKNTIVWREVALVPDFNKGDKKCRRKRAKRKARS